ncbi:OmpP1/FadL family transporter [Chitinophaga tropicalis]|uniref:Transporter n=1 Tax=Chitinophaga tropicalis TaxID=2683588 RepID=A0A7K1U5M0_9BACT|nr:hypothetical protein [Chitinophaga tropicalis]MVT09265.1 hypothetical protein [Chitinophaga tropicalis]
MVKRLVLVAALSGCCYTLQAQTIDDALRFGSSDLSGTTRGQSVGGALGSLGGEVSSLFVNPAGVGFFRTNDFSFTLGLQNVNNKGTYLGSTASDNKTVPNITNATMIFGGRRKKPDSKWQNFSFGFGFNRTANYNERVYYTGNNNTSSLSLNYATAANAANITNPDVQLGTNPDNMIGSLAHTSVLAYQTYLINGFEDGSGNYIGGFYSAAQATDSSINVKQENIVNSKGSNNELSFAFGANYNDQLYLGGSIGFPIISFERDKGWQETNINTVTAGLNNFIVTEYLKTEGTGANFKLGAIYKPIKSLNLGATFHSPSWLTFTDTYSTVMSADTKIYGGVRTASSTESNNGYDDESKYTIRTPWKGVVSATYLFAPSADTRRPTGFISVDYEYMDYASMKMRFKNGFSTDRDDTEARNDAIRSTYQGASNIRIGGELKLHVIAFRLGYANYGSPYKNSAFDGARQYYTGGIGYRNQGFYLDLGFVYGTSKRLEQPYVLDDTSFYKDPSPASIKTNTSNVLATVGWKF